MPPRLPHRPLASLIAVGNRSLRMLVVLGMMFGMFPPLAQPGTAYASSVTSAVFTGGADTLSVGGTLYAKSGSKLTLTVKAADETKCVDVSGALTGHQDTQNTQDTWTFQFTAGSEDGQKSVTVTASPGANSQGKCTGASGSAQASYTLDNTAPVVTAALTPAPNAAGWNNADVRVAWTATDTGSGVASGPTPASSTETANGIVTRTSTATDRVGNSGSGSVTVRVDKAKPTITTTQTDSANGTVTVTFTCSDSKSGGDESSGIASCVADGTSPASNSKTVQPGTIVTGTATDVAGNTTTASVTATRSDTTPPTINHSVTPAPNAAGWNKADATVTFTCDDNAGGSGVKSCVADGTSPASASRSISTETNGTLVGGTATDNANNTATRSVTVKLDKTVPTIQASRSPVVNGFGWNNSDVTVSFTCSDVGTQASGIKSCPGPVVLDKDGANQSASGTATDNADNASAAASVTGINVDKTAPTLVGTPTTTPNAAGWYKGDVTIAWTGTDAVSGIDTTSQPANSIIGTVGVALVERASIKDKAGNETFATSAPVNIDRMPPTTVASAPGDWNNVDVTIKLTPSDGGSGVKATYYKLDGAAQQAGTSVTISAAGTHTLEYWSVDNADNVEAAKSVTVKIDKTTPTINYTQSPPVNKNNWNNTDVTVTFECGDTGGADIKSCTAPQTVTAEGKNHKVTGTATDQAGNTTTVDAFVNIDKTEPAIHPHPGLEANEKGWYNHGVVIEFDCLDAGDERVRSGIDECAKPVTLDKEGANQRASGDVLDNAGNRATGIIEGINIDLTDPKLVGTPTTNPNAAGWYKGDVTIAWTCSDVIAGIDAGACPANSTVDGEGNNLSTDTVAVTDRAGRTTQATQAGIRIDRTAPTTSVSTSGTLTNGWYNADFQITLKGDDNLSGVDATYYSVDGGAAQPYTAAFSFGTEGTHTITFWSTDEAGHVEDKTGNSITLKLDKTPPTLNGAATTAPNGNNGWYTGDVTIKWTCADATSGLDGDCPADSTIEGEGANLSASASISDQAGNSTNKTVGGIKIDRTAPTTTKSVPAVPASGWYTGAVQVTLNADDNLSGVDATYYKVDGGDAQTYNGPFSFGTEGTHTITFWSKDKAGNTETVGAPITLNIDKSAPITEVIDPISPDTGWFVTSGIPFAFDANDAPSGIAATYYTIDGGDAQTYGKPFTADLSTGSHTVTYWSVDIAGNKETVQTLEIKVDTVPPTITGDTVTRNDDGTTTSRKPNAAGWFNSPVDVAFTCTDADSGIDGVVGCAGDTTLTNDGADQKVRGDAVDVAGNRSSNEFGPVNIDQTKPTLVGVPSNPNGASWYKDDVTVTWFGDDALSGLDIATQPQPSTITGEGSNLSAGPVTIKDKAGNTSQVASVTGIKIDRTAPVINGGATTQPNAAGWYQGEVVVDFKCEDPKLKDGTAGSGVASCPTSKLLKGDGASQSVTSDAATDVAGNSSAGKTVGGINIDGTAPTTTSDNLCTKTNGFCTGSTADIVLTSVDQTGLSGVKEIRYRVNGGTEQFAAGATKTVSVPLDGEGEATVSYYAVDNAGNIETANAVTLKYDNIAPAVTHTLTPKPNSDEWNNSDVTVHFDAKDNDAGSGVDASTVTKDVVVSTETAGLKIAGTATDTAGNVGTDSVTIKLDKTKPTITSAITSGTKGNNGWYVGPVTVTFTCADALSTIATCPDPVILTANGANTASGTATDKAGNSATATPITVNIDRENPTLTTADVNVQGGIYTLGSVPAATCTAKDDFSGLASCSVTVGGGNANGVGTFTYTATATDKAGNTSTLQGTFTVKYRFDGFLQPINDTAHQVGTSTSIFKAGSTVPAKFQLKNSAGTIVQAATAPVWLTPVKGSATTAPVDESVYTASDDSGSTYRYDATAQQYIYNWKTGTGGNYWRIGVKFDDGQTYYVNIGLR